MKVPSPAIIIPIINIYSVHILNTTYMGTTVTPGMEKAKPISTYDRNNVWCSLERTSSVNQSRVSARATVIKRIVVKKYPYAGELFRGLYLTVNIFDRPEFHLFHFKVSISHVRVYPKKRKQ